jgi:hypothetical protein
MKFLSIQGVQDENARVIDSTMPHDDPLGATRDPRGESDDRRRTDPLRHAPRVRPNAKELAEYGLPEGMPPRHMHRNTITVMIV